MKIEGNPVRVLYGYGLRSRHCVHLRVFALELAAAGVAREGHGVSDVGHARDETPEPLEAEAVAAVRHLVRVRVRVRVRERVRVRVRVRVQVRVRVSRGRSRTT